MTILSGHSRLAGILGWPVAHSRSPRLHGFWLRRHGIDGAYMPLPVRPERFADAVRSLADLGFAGANVTIPHKEAAFAACDRVDATAHRAGAVNTLVFRDGRIEGSNTDGFGFLAHAMASVPGWSPAAGPVVVLGAGGSARAIAAALLDAGCPRLTLVNRTPARAEALAQALSGPIEVADRPPLEGAALLVNTTSQGMQGQPPLVLDLAPLPATAIVADIVYVPRETGLLAAARARGLRTVDGLGMLLHQARPGFSEWFGTMPQVDSELEEFVGGDIPLR
ncbi:shikimate dehydrogenase [Siccirubricoccus sp. KC 17139]|uniref:Shikimate dehydrogenase (NADP(+)) n=1 Tax=Siccirubricoccus soli TaxID=2899147 RepID=A0ABT1D925_9PROT|nr:shikimate dehydrogenase [Siccirubricoccus soli]MCO6418445.1 shikimate dehydrogenase [Siccirubricoccus soli]MCP2684580.1 shikimate dehydrogenase [Siccirubricoccus soli]